MSGTVCVRSYDAPEVDEREILRYAGVRGDAPGVETMLEECLSELLDRLSYRVCFGTYPIRVEGDEVLLDRIVLRSADLSKRLFGCDRAILFAATVGNEPDRLIARYNRFSPARALLIQAIGSERVEALCDAFCGDMRKESAEGGRVTRPRYSPGYGDLSLETQREVFRLLDCSRRIGLALNESLLMSPSKSVTAVIGIEETNEKGNRKR